MKQVIFITATDTDAGKTTIAEILLKRSAHAGLQTAALKPIACGSTFRNEDADVLRRTMTLKKLHHEVNPYLFAAPCSPDIAAKIENLEVTVADLMTACKPAFSWDVDYLLIEGCGGWYVPLNTTETLADFVKALKIPVLLVVAVRLGCLNHALLTAKAILADNVECIGWIANCLDPNFKYARENIATLQQRLPWPLLECVEFQN